MKKQEIFAEKKELRRLDVQHKLLEEYEKPILGEIFNNGVELSVLDIGSNDGRKTVSLFSDGRVKKVIGLEYDECLALDAEKEKKDDRFSFYSMDVESDDFSSSLEGIMKEKDIDGFDIIYMSFILMHLSSPGKVLAVLRNYLKRSGKLVVVEADDSRVTLSGERTPLLSQFFNILDKDKYSGNRSFGKNIEKTLLDAGYGDISLKCDSIDAAADEKEKRDMIYTVFFSYLEEDVKILLSEEDRAEYREWEKWLKSNINELESEITNGKGTIRMGMKILTAGRGR